MKEVNVKGRQITVTKFGAIEGWRLVHKISSIIAPSLGFAAEDNYSKAIGALFTNCSESDFLSLLKQFSSVVLIDGKKVNFELDFADYQFAMAVVNEVIDYNFKEFFLSVIEQAQGIAGSAMKAT